jgi:hypothetical protein
MNKIILKIMALGLFLSGCDVFKKTESTAKALNTAPATLNKKPPPPTQATFPVTDAINNTANAHDVLNTYINPTDPPEIKKVKAQNILRLNKDGKSFLNHLADLPDAETSAVIRDLSNNLSDSGLLAQNADQEFIKKLIDNRSEQSLLEIFDKADVDELNLPTEDSDKNYLLSITDAPNVTNKIIGPDKDAFVDTMLASDDTDNDKKIAILKNLKNGLNPAEKAKIELKQVDLAKNILADAALSVDDKADALNALKSSLPADKKQEIEVAQVTAIFNDEAKLLDPAVLFEEASKNNLLSGNKVISKSDLFKVDGAQDNLVGFYVAKLDKLKENEHFKIGDLFDEELKQEYEDLTSKENSAILNLKTKINPSSPMAWRKIIEASPYLKKTYFDHGLIKDKQTAELLEYKIESAEVIAAAQTLSIDDFEGFIFNNFNANTQTQDELVENLKGLVNQPLNNIIYSLANRDIADVFEAGEIIQMLVKIDNVLGNDLNNNLPKNVNGETDLLLLLKNNITKPEVFNYLYQELTDNLFTLADNTEEAFQTLISTNWDIVGKLAQADMSDVGKVGEVIDTLNILVSASGGKDKFNAALRANTIHNPGAGHPYYLISPMYKLLQKDINNKIAYFCLQNDVQIINNGITTASIEDMINNAAGRVQTNLKHLLMNNDVTRDVYLKYYTGMYSMYKDYSKYIDFVLANDNVMDIEDKFERIKKAVRSVYNNNELYANSIIGPDFQNKLAKSSDQKGYLKYIHSFFADYKQEIFYEFIGKPKPTWVYGDNNFYNSGKTYEQLKKESKVW